MEAAVLMIRERLTPLFCAFPSTLIFCPRLYWPTALLLAIEAVLLVYGPGRRAAIYRVTLFEFEGYWPTVVLILSSF